MRYGIKQVSIPGGRQPEFNLKPCQGGVMKKLFFALFGFWISSGGLSYAAERPFNAALVDPVQIFDDTDDISGLRLNLFYGKNESVKGLDLGIGVGHSKSEFKGVGIHYGANLVQGQGSGLQLANVANIVIGDFSGVQFAGCNFLQGGGKGLQLGYVQIVQEDYSGIELGIVNMVYGNYDGVQLGVVNYVGDNFKGLQFGLVNIGGIEKGLQIGLVNVNKNKDPLPFFPFVNFRF